MTLLKLIISLNTHKRVESFRHWGGRTQKKESESNKLHAAAIEWRLCGESYKR